MTLTNHLFGGYWSTYLPRVRHWGHSGERTRHSPYLRGAQGLGGTLAQMQCRVHICVVPMYVQVHTTYLCANTLELDALVLTPRNN